MKLVVGGFKEEELENIKNMALDMFDQTQKMLEMSKELLNEDDNVMALELIDEDKVLDDLQNDLTLEINAFIIKEQPKATDLRMVLGTLLLIGDLERIGDNCKSFAKLLIKQDIERKEQVKLVERTFDILLERMAEVKIAYEKSDHYLAKMIAKKSTVVDALSVDLITDINKKLVQSSDFDEVKGLGKTINLAKTFKRSEEHLINICEQISYISKGQLYHYS